MPAHHRHHRTARGTARTLVATRLQRTILGMSAGSKASRACLVPCVALVVALAVAAPASAAGDATVTTTVNKISYSEHYDNAGCGIPGTTEYWTGIGHRHVTALAGGTFDVVLGDNWKIVEVSDDPSLPPRERQGTDEIITHLINNGPAICSSRRRPEHKPQGRAARSS